MHDIGLEQHRALYVGSCENNPYVCDQLNYWRKAQPNAFGPYPRREENGMFVGTVVYEDKGRLVIAKKPYTNGSFPIIAHDDPNLEWLGIDERGTCCYFCLRWGWLIEAKTILADWFGITLRNDAKSFDRTTFVALLRGTSEYSHDKSDQVWSLSDIRMLTDSGPNPTEIILDTRKIRARVGGMLRGLPYWEEIHNGHFVCTVNEETFKEYERARSWYQSPLKNVRCLVTECLSPDLGEVRVAHNYDGHFFNDR